MNNDIRTALLHEAHRLILEAAEAAIAQIADLSQHNDGAGPTTLAYPPGDGRTDANCLTELEARALAQIAASGPATTGLRKLVRAAASGPLFGFFCLLDGVADPELWTRDVWLGADLADPKDGEDREMLHDAFYESYWAFEEQRSN
jgi:hypothetical protein